MTRRAPAVSPQLRALGPDIRLLAVFLDAVAAYGRYCVQVQGRVDTAILTEKADGEAEGWNEDHTQRTMRARWGVVDQEGVYLVAGLTKAEREVAFLHYDRQLDAADISRLLNRSAVHVRVQLHRANERLRRLALTPVQEAVTHFG